MSVNETSKLAFYKLVETKKLPKRRKEVATALLLALKPMTSSMLEEWCSKREMFRHLKRCTITGRFNELHSAGIIKEFKTAPCEVTGSTAKYYTIVESL